MPNGSLQFQILNEIGIIAQLSQTAFERVIPTGMTLPQFTVLNHFARLGGTRSPAELAAAFQVTRATMTSTLQRLEAKGLVLITPDPKDGRAKRVALTDSGRDMRDVCLKELAPLLERQARFWPLVADGSLLQDLIALRRALDENRKLT
jgi:DNA-binding MarR family transcriptional regulator